MVEAAAAHHIIDQRGENSEISRPLTVAIVLNLMVVQKSRVSTGRGTGLKSYPEADKLAGRAQKRIDALQRNTTAASPAGQIKEYDGDNQLRRGSQHIEAASGI